MKHQGATQGYPRDPWFAEHPYTVRRHCGVWLRIYVGGLAEHVEEEEEAQAGLEIARHAK